MNVRITSTSREGEPAQRCATASGARHNALHWHQKKMVFVRIFRQTGDVLVKNTTNSSNFNNDGLPLACRLYFGASVGQTLRQETAPAQNLPPSLCSDFIVPLYSVWAFISQPANWARTSSGERQAPS